MDFVMRQRTRNYGPRRAAFSLLELTVAAAIMASIIAASLQMLHALEGYQRRCERIRSAQQAVAAVAEEVGNLPWDTLSTDAAQTIKLPKSLQDRLQGTTLTVRVLDESEPTSSKRIHVALTENPNSGELRTLSRITCWSFPDYPSKTQ